MRLSYRLSFSLIAGLTLVSLVFAVYQASGEARSEREEIEQHALVLAESLQKTVAPLLTIGDYRELESLVDQFQNHERVAGVAVYGANGARLASTAGLESSLTAAPAAVTLALRRGWGSGQFFRLADEPMHVFAL